MMTKSCSCRQNNSLEFSRFVIFIISVALLGDGLLKFNYQNYQKCQRNCVASAVTCRQPRTQPDDDEELILLLHEDRRSTSITEKMVSSKCTRRSMRVSVSGDEKKNTIEPTRYVARTGCTHTPIPYTDVDVHA